MMKGVGAWSNAQGLDGEPIRAHANPLFDTREYEIEFIDGTHEKYQANIIAENMFAQVDSEGNQFLLLQEITDHKHDHSAIPIGRNDSKREWTDQTKDDERMVSTSAVERWFYQLGEVERLEGIEPS